MQHCSPQILHFHGLESQWQPLCKKYRVESGNVIAQNVHTSEDGSIAASPWVEVITPPSEGDAREAFEFLARPRAEIRLRKSSLRRLFSGDTFINEDKLEETPRLSPPLASPSFTSPEPDSSCVLGSCLIGMSVIDGVMLVGRPADRELLATALSPDCGELGPSPFMRVSELPKWFDCPGENVSLLSAMDISTCGVR